MKNPMTLFQRSKAAGMVAGPNNMRAMRVLKEKEGQDDGAPPNLRDAGSGPDLDRCFTCNHHDDGECSMYQYPVKPHQVCDSFESEEPEGEDQSEDEGDHEYR